MKLEEPTNIAHEMIFGPPERSANLPGFAGPSPDAIIANARNSKDSKGPKEKPADTKWTLPLTLDRPKEQEPPKRRFAYAKEEQVGRRYYGGYRGKSVS